MYFFTRFYDCLKGAVYLKKLCYHLIDLYDVFCSVEHKICFVHTTKVNGVHSQVILYWSALLNSRFWPTLLVFVYLCTV